MVEEGYFFSQNSRVRYDDIQRRIKDELKNHKDDDIVDEKIVNSITTNEART